MPMTSYSAQAPAPCDDTRRKPVEKSTRQPRLTDVPDVLATVRNSLEGARVAGGELKRPMML